MKRTVKVGASTGYSHISTGPKAQPGTSLGPSVSQRRKVSVSSLTSTAPRTADEVRIAIAQGRFAELKPEQV